RLITPGCTQATRSTGSTDRMRSILVVTITTGSPTGTAPPASPVPEPRATNGRPWRRAICTAAATSAVSRGKQATAADPASTEASRPYSPSSTAPVRTRSGASPDARSAARPVVPAVAAPAGAVPGEVVPTGSVPS